MGRPKADACPQGHEYTEENSYYHPSRNGRVCRICKREQGRVASKTYREKLKRVAEIRAMFMASQPRERDAEGRLIMIRHDFTDTQDVAAMDPTQRQNGDAPLQE